MKKLCIISFLLIATSTLVAQTNYEILERNLPYNKFATSFTGNIIGTSENFVMYHWQKYIEKHGGTTYLVSNNEANVEFESEHVAFPFIKNELVTLHTRFTPNDRGTGVLITLWIEFKDGTFYSSKTHKDSANKIKQWLLAFDQEIMKMNGTH